MASILLTGGAGYVGSVCCAELLSLGHSVVVVDDLSSGFKEAIPLQAEFSQISFGDSSSLKSVLSKRKFDAVFHFAAKALVADSVKNPGVYFQENVACSIAMLEALRAAGINSFVFSSSAAVYGAQSSARISEDSLTQPINAYGLSKLMLEQALEWYATAYGWSVVAFRYFNAAGATEDLGERHSPETHLIPLILEAAAGERSAFEIYGEDYDTADGTCLRDYIHVKDIAHAHIAALQRVRQPGMRVYNIGTGLTYSVRQIWAAAEQVTGKRIPVRISGRRPGDPPILCASNSRIMQELHWKAEHSSLEEILNSAWRWKQKQIGTKNTALARE